MRAPNHSLAPQLNLAQLHSKGWQTPKNLAQACQCICKSKRPAHLLAGVAVDLWDNLLADLGDPMIVRMHDAGDVLKHCRSLQHTTTAWVTSDVSALAVHIQTDV